MTKKFGIVVAAGLGLAITPTLSQGATGQQIYDQAQAAFDRDDWRAAIAGFEQVAGKAGTKPNRSQAIIRSRLAQAHLELGHLERARTIARNALDGLAPDDGVERAKAWTTIAASMRFDLEMPGAIAAYKEAIAAAPPQAAPIIMDARFGLALAAMAIDPAQSATALDLVLADPAMAQTAKRSLATVEDLRGRAELNLGNTRAAIGYFQRAVQHSGGVGAPKVSLSQVPIRGDSAIAYQLIHDDDNTRKYLTYTGAGHVQWDNWNKAASLRLPVCGEATGLRADDTAVVEFAIGDDGRVIGAAVVYTNRPGEQTIEFARAVRSWRWSPVTIAKLDPFWRASIRMQLRCVSRPEPAQLTADFYDATRNWLIDNQVADTDIAPLFDGPVAKTDPRLQGTGIASIPALISRFIKVDSSEHDPALAARLNEAIDKASAPADVRALVLFLLRQGNGNAAHRALYFRSQANNLGAQIPAFETAWPATRAAYWLRLEYALALENSGDMAAARPQLEAVVGAPEPLIDISDPIRQIATLHLAMLRKQNGDHAAANAIIYGTGLSAEQCSLFDVRPVATKGQFSTNDFPTEALRWMFEGYTKVDYDIDADGRTINVRTVLAYPPFVFGSSTENAIKRFRYIPITIDGASAGCSGQTQSVTYRIPK